MYESKRTINLGHTISAQTLAPPKKKKKKKKSLLGHKIHIVKSDNHSALLHKI